jgi:transcription elongation factor GreA
MNKTQLTKTVMMTKNGYQLLKSKLIDLEKESKIISNKLTYARIDGDLSENADWKALRENLEITHDKINKIRKDLENSNIIQGNDKNNDSVRIGNKVVYSIIGKDETLEVEITSEIEANPFVNKVSYLSPLGSALLNKEIGKVVEINNSNVLNKYKVKILKIR